MIVLDYGPDAGRRPGARLRPGCGTTAPVRDYGSCAGLWPGCVTTARVRDYGQGAELRPGCGTTALVYRLCRVRIVCLKLDQGVKLLIHSA